MEQSCEYAWGPQGSLDLVAKEPSIRLLRLDDVTGDGPSNASSSRSLAFPA